MKLRKYILPALVAVLFLGGCRSSSELKKQKDKEEQESSRLIHELMAAPVAEEFTASLSININGTKVNGELRMRRGRSIQISASVLGLMEMARVEFLPDMVVIMDRFHNLYSVCHYVEIPYRNELGLDFDVVQAFIWNRIFSPGNPAESDAIYHLNVERADADGNRPIKDLECGYTFVTDGKDRLYAVSKSGNGYSFRIDYSDFSEVLKNWNYPLALSAAISVSGSNNKVSARMSSVSTDKKNWPDRTQVTRRMRQVSLDELLENLNL